MDYDHTITPGARCANCKNHGQVIDTAAGRIVRCPVYGVYNEDDQAEHCINYCAIKREMDAAGGEG